MGRSGRKIKLSKYNYVQTLQCEDRLQKVPFKKQKKRTLDSNCSNFHKHIEVLTTQHAGGNKSWSCIQRRFCVQLLVQFVHSYRVYTEACFFFFFLKKTHPVFLLSVRWCRWLVELSGIKAIFKAEFG